MYLKDDELSAVRLPGFPASATSDSSLKLPQIS